MQKKSLTKQIAFVILAILAIQSITFSQFADNSAEIYFEQFAATTDGETVTVSWSTGNENGILGFNIYRETNGGRELLTTAPIAGTLFRSTAKTIAQGENYRWVDKNAPLDAVYYLEDISLEGNRTLYGPVVPVFQYSADKTERNAALLSDLTNTQNSSAQKEFVRETNENDFALNPSVQFEIAGKPGVKISIARDGWYYVSAASLQANGFDLASNRNNWQLFCGGEEVAIKVNTDGAIEFFGRGTDTINTDRQVYYLINGNKAGLRLTTVKSGRMGNNPPTSYVSTVERKERVNYLSSIINGEADNWFGAAVFSSSQTVQNLSLSNIAAGNTARLRVRLQGVTSGAHYVNVRFNDTDLGQVTYNAYENREFEFTVPASAILEGTNSVKFQAVSSSDISVVDSIILDYSRLYRAVNNQIRFTVASGKSVSIGGFTSNTITVNEIQSGAVGVRAGVTIRTVNGEYVFDLGSAPRNREFVAVAQGEQPASVERNIPSTLNAADNRADFVIIAPAIFQNQANQLAGMRQSQGLQSKVVLTEDIADEYGYGIPTPQAIKSFLQNATTNWTLRPRYAVLFGDSSYDQRNYLAQPNRNQISTKLVDTYFMETASDSWLADFNGDQIEDIALGRLPAGDAVEADLMIAKLVRYDQQPARTEKISVLTSDTFFETYTQNVQNNLPPDVTAVRIDRSTMTDAEMRSRIASNLNNNPMLTVYTGHGMTIGWTSAGVFRTGDAAALTNSQLGFYLLTTCLNGYTHNVNNESLAEALLKSANGGAIAVLASSSMSFIEPQSQVSQSTVRMIFTPQNGPMRIGDIVRQAKLSTPDQDVRYTSLLIGDPTVFIK